MLKTRNGRNERRREGQSLSLPIMPPKLRKMAFLQSGHLLLKIFLNKFRPKSPRLAGKGSIFYFDIFPMQFVAVVGVWFAAANIQYMEHPPFSLKWVQAGFFLFPCVKEALDGQSAAADSLNTAWFGVTTTIAKKTIAAAFRRWYEGCKKCTKIEKNYVEKSQKIKQTVKLRILFLFHLSGLESNTPRIAQNKNQV